MASKRFKVAAAAGGLLGAGIVLGFGPFVRYQAAKAAAAYGAEISVEAVRPTWLGVVLRGIDVRLEDVPSATIRLESVEVEVGLSGQRVILRGGTVSAVGPRERVIGEAEAWRVRRAGKAGGGSDGGGRKTELEGLRLVWKNQADAPSESVSATGVRFFRAEGKTALSAASANVSVGRASLSVLDGQVVLLKGDGGYRVDGLAASSVDAELSLPEPEPAPKVATGPEGGERPAKAKVPKEDEGDGGERRGAALRELLIRAAEGIDLALAQGAKVDLAGVTARLRRGEEKLNLGPGNLSVRRASGALVVELSPGEAALAKGAGAQQALTFRLQVPLRGAPDAPQEIVADVRGGPIWLSTLGVRDGDMGLFDVGKTSLVSRAQVVLSADGEVLRVDGEGKLEGLSLRNDALSDEPVAGLDLAWRGKAELRLDGSRIKVDEGELDLGSIRLLGRGEYQRVGDAHRARGELEMPLTACQAMLDSAPKGLVPKLAGMRLAGSFGIQGKVRFDTARLDRDFVLDWDVSHTCRVVEVPPELHVDRFKRAFRRPAYGPGGARVEVEAGPGTASWVPYSGISRFMEVAVMTTEDSGFLRHHGFDAEAIKNSIRENLRKRRFVRGASTISMQLAKNLYLERTKSVSRKLQEALLTMYLEQELTKEQIMELYLNVVEFGPMVYGVGPAARHYFNASASQLSLGQALYIASILPNPKVQHFAAGGAVTPGWSNYLRKLMQIANKRERITDEELEEGMVETVVRGSPVPYREPRGEGTASLDGAPADEGPEPEFLGP